MASYIKSDLEFILEQILIAERHAAGEPLVTLVPNTEVSFGLRTVDGSFNQLIPDQTEFGAADNTFPRLLEPDFMDAEAGTSYTQTSGLVVDSDPRTISNLISDQTASNPAAYAAAFDAGVDGILGDDPNTLDVDESLDDVLKDGAVLVDGLRADGTPFQTFFLPNTSPDEGLSAPFNAWMTFFGQFFDHGLSLVTKGGSGTVFIPLQPDDPLYVEGGSTNFMVVTRATNLPGPDGTLGTADDIHEHTNTTSPFVDQNQTYSSHPSHQVFLRAYEFDANGEPQATGGLIVNRDLGLDGIYGTADDVVLGGMATWAVVKAQARDILGINLTDADVFSVPLLATDQYGMFIRGPNGFPQVVMQDDTLVEGNPAAPVSLANAVSTGHGFLDDIAHAASPRDAQTGLPLSADSDSAVGLSEPGTYDNELLDAHYIAGDGRVNENIGLTAVHHVFHSEHNRLVEHTKQLLLDSGDVAFLNNWLLTPVAAIPADPSTLVWDGERLFQAAKFGTEMQYQHLVFEEFARTIQPNVDAFLDFDDTVDPSIVAEFAHTVYRFGHSMLTETIDRLDPNYGSSEIGLIQAFLNPLEFAASGATPDEAAGAIVRGVTRQVGNEIDEFVTEALRNNLLGLPLDLPAINLARGRDTGIPSLNAARRTFYEGTGDNQLRPYESWADFVQFMKHPESLINFIAAYGTHGSITTATTMEDKRTAAALLVLGGAGEPADRMDFLHSTGAWASGVDGVTTTGLDDVDFWIGGLAEAKMPFGGMLGSTFNFVFETQLEALQNGDRLYYLHRLAGSNFLSELENNSFAKLIMQNTDTVHLPALVFQTPGLILEVNQSVQFNGDLGAADPVGDGLVPLVIRNNPATPGTDANYLQYTGDEHVVLGGTSGNDILIASIGDDTIWGDEGNDRIEGGHGNDLIEAGAGDDIITDMGGDDVIKGDEGNDVISGGAGVNLILAGPGKDFIITGEDETETFAGTGDDFILGSRLDAFPFGNEGNDWLEGGLQDGAAGDNFDPFNQDKVIGHDVFIGDGGFDEALGEGGDDIIVGSEGPDKYDGMSGFDWVTFKDDRAGVNADMFKSAFDAAPVPASSAAVGARFAQVEGLSGSTHADILRGDNADAAQIALAGFNGSVLTNLDLITGLRAFLGSAAAGADGITGNADDRFDAGNIILGGSGSDILEGRGGNDILDGDRWLNVRISVRQNIDGTGPEIATYDSMVPLIPSMLAGTINPGQLVIQREMLTGDSGYDTAVFSGNLEDYTVSTVDGVTTVTHNVDPNGGGGVISDGVDRLTNIERLQFNDQTVLLSGTNTEPTGLLAVSDTTPVVGQTLTVNLGSVVDGDGLTNPVSYIWQAETVAGSGLFRDIAGPNGGAPTALGASFTVTADLEGLALRVKAHYQDGNGVLETVFSDATATVDEGTPPPPPEALINGPQDGIVSPGIHYIGSDLQFILAQIKIAERHAAGEDLLDLVDNPRMAQGLRTVDGSFNNLVQGQTEFGAADNTFPRLLEPDFIDADAGTSYTQTSGTVIDSDPRTISNLIVDQTANNPAAVAAAAGVDGAGLVSGTRADGITEFETFFIPNTAPDEGLSAPFNAWMTFFGQFFDHGLDLVTKGGSGTVFIPLQPDDPLYVVGGSTNFMVLTRATNQPGADGVLGTADDIHEQTNTTSPFVDQNQTYSSHPSHQVFLRAYEFDANGDPQATGDLIVNRDLGPDGTYGTADDVILGGMATWAVVKAQARDILGINLTDADVLNVPLLATDAYGMFIRGPNGFPQVVMPGNVLVEGNPAAPISLVGAVRTGHAFLDDIAHTASPVNGQTGAPLAADADTTAGNPVGAGEYDNELLDAHYIAGDGRVNENIGLTAVHHVFHHEHNRLVEHTKDVVLDTARGGDVSFLNEWLLNPVTEVPVDLSTLVWNGERLFQAAKFGTEMQYQHLVFEEFARTIQPGIDPFLPNVQNYQTEIDPSIVAEFAHTVYRFGHSMLTETIDRLDASYVNSEIGLIDAFLNPLAFAASGPTPEEAAGAIIRGLTRQVGNEIDEFVTEALRNNLLGLPLDLPAINLARGRDTGIPSLNAARTQFYEATGNSVLKPYESWFEFVQHIKHPESLVNFIAAYGTHSTITSATTLEGKRAAASLIVLGGTGAPADRLDFLMSQGAWGTLETGLNLVDFWIGGLAEAKTPFGGMLGSTFNFVFEEQMEKLQNADRFYYLERSAGLNFVTELENNSFAKMVMAATDIAHLPALIFQTNLMLEVDQSRQFNQSVMAGPDGVLGDDPLTLDVDESLDDDPTGSSDPVGDNPLVPLVIRDDPSTLGLDTNYLQYTGGDHVVLGGTDGDDTLIGGIGDDSFWGDAGNDRIEGGDGNDAIRGGAGDDIITDLGGDDNIQGDDGNDVIHAGNGLFNLILGGFGNDFIVNGEDGGEAFGGPGNDFMLGSDGVEQNMGNEGDDWLEGGLLDGSPGDNFDPLGLDMIVGNDVYLGSGLADIMNGEGGDDIMVGSSGPGDKYLGASGFDWATFKDEDFGVSMDLSVRAFDVGPIPVAAGVIARFAEVEGLSGSAQSDYLRGDDADALSIPNAGAQGSVLTNFDLVSGLRDFVGDAGNGADGTAGNADDSFGAGNIILGGDGSDVIEGRGGDDLIDGDMWLNVRISVRANNDGTGAEIASFDSMRPMVPLMLAGTYNPGQLVIVREILEGSGGFNFDTAVFTGNSGDYDISTVGGVTTVAHILDGVAGAGIDGTDRLTGIERLRFADETIVLADGVNAEPEGLLFILDDVTGDFEFEPATGQVLRVSAEDVTDADNPGGVIPGPLTYYWQADFGTGFFQDIMTQTGVGAQLATGTTFTVTPDLAGLSLRVRGVYEDAQGVLEEVRSFPTFAVNALPTGAVLIDDTTPLLGETLTASNTLADANGLGVVSYQWQVSTDGGATWEDILDAIEPSFVVTPAQIGAILRVAASYEDGLGTLETVFSAATEVVSFINTVPTGVVLIDDTTPVLTQVLTASDTLADADGLGTVAYQWQVSDDNGATWDDIVGATGSTYAVTEVGARLRVAASYTDGLGTLETVFSAATGIVAAFNSITGTGAANTLIGTELPDFIQAFGGNDTLIGGAGNDTLQGGVGVDSMVGGTGDDLYLVNVTADVVVELADEGIDTVDSAATYTLSANVENLILRSGFGNINGTGNASGNVLTGNEGANLLSGLDGNDTLSGNAGNDTLNGGTGADSMVGGMGNDLYFVDDAGDQVTELAGGGADEVRTTLAAYTLADQVEILRFTGVGSFAGTGNALNNAIFGGTGNDTLAGGAGNDTMTGGAGNDTYHVDSTGDVITEAAGGGTDTVISSGTAYTLGATLENLVSTNAVGATLTGNGSANQIQGGDGNDNIAAAQGNDTVDGGAGNDTLGGGLGVDLMTGGTGDDLYLVNVTADVVVELADEGIDTVDSAASYTLSANVENLILRSGFGNINGTGNASDNVLTGNAQANQLLGLDGNDTLIGNGGNDTLNGGAGDDSMVGGAGNDTFVFGSGFGHDAITGFDSAPAGGQDRLNISALGINAGNFGASVSISAVGGNTLIGLGADSITLVGVNAATETQQDFILA